MPNFSTQQGVTNRAWRQGSGSTANWKPSGRSTSTQKPNTFSGRRRTQRSSKSRSGFKKPRGKATSSAFNFNNVRRRARANTAPSGSPRPSPKPSSANNLSRFGKGLLGRFRPVLDQAKNLASALGTRGASLARNLASSKFLAGANSIPAIGLIAANAVIWTNNLRQLRNIYRGGTNSTISFIPRSARLLEPEIPRVRPPNTSLGTSGVTYELVTSTPIVQNLQLVGFTETFNTHSIRRTAPLPQVELHTGGFNIPELEHWSFLGRGLEPIFDNRTRGYAVRLLDTGEFRSVGVGSGRRITGWIRVDRQPDLEDRTDIGEPRIIVGGAPNSAIPQLQPSQIVNPPTGNFKPSGVSNIRAASSSSNTSNLIPTNPLPAVDKPPEIPATSTTPAVLNTPLPNNTAQSTPSPARVPSLSDLIPAAAIGVSTPPSGNGNAQLNEPPPPTTTPRTNRCRRGCGGARGGNPSFAPGSQANTQIASLINDAFVQNPILQRIDTTTQTSRGILSSATHGLERIQSFAATAWEATRGDKILNAVSTVLLIHNGVMLSRNLGQTIGDAASTTLQALGIDDPEGNPIDVNQFVGGKIQELLTSLLGQQNYEDLTRRIASANRVYQSTANLLDTTQSLFDSARTIAELTAENTGKIGNALKESGAVYESAYDDFVEQINPQNVTQRRLERFRQGLEQIEDNVSTVSQISSEVVQTRENFTQLREEKNQWQAEFNELQQTLATERKEEKDDVQVTANISSSDFLPDETSSSE